MTRILVLVEIIFRLDNVTLKHTQETIVCFMVRWDPNFYVNHVQSTIMCHQKIRLGKKQHTKKKTKIPHRITMKTMIMCYHRLMVESTLITF